MVLGPEPAPLGSQHRPWLLVPLSAESSYKISEQAFEGVSKRIEKNTTVAIAGNSKLLIIVL